MHQFHFLYPWCRPGISLFKQVLKHIHFLGSTDEAVRPRNGRNFLRVTQPVKGSAWLDPEAPDFQAGLYSLLCYLQAILKPKIFEIFQAPQCRGATPRVNVPLALPSSSFPVHPSPGSLHRLQSAFSPSPHSSGPETSWA